MNIKDRVRLRELAKHQLEIANSPKNLERVELWKALHRFDAERPTLNVETGTFANECIVPFLQCEDETARGIEYNLIHSFINIEAFDDDYVVPPYYGVGYDSWFTLFGQHIKESVIKDSNGTEMGHKFEHIIGDLEDDYHKIEGPSVYGIDKAATQRKIEFLGEIFGDILPIRLQMGCLYAVPTQQVVHMMGMENMLYAMYDYPELFSKMMDRIAEDYIAYFKFLEEEGALLQTRGFESLGQGTFCFWDEEDITGKVRTEDVWGFLDSQETVGISPDMFREFIYPCYKKISDIYGRLSYGCCEPVNQFWNDIKTYNNLKKVSISPWCDEDYMANELRGKEIVYHRKPSPNYLGVGTVLDEDALREHFKKTLIAARGCTLEFAQRDVYTINNDIGKVKRYVQIWRECVDKYWCK